MPQHRDLEEGEVPADGAYTILWRSLPGERAWVAFLDSSEEVFCPPNAEPGIVELAGLYTMNLEHVLVRLYQESLDDLRQRQGPVGETVVLVSFGQRI